MVCRYKAVLITHNHVQHRGLTTATCSHPPDQGITSYRETELRVDN